MAEELIIARGTREEQYKQLIPQIEALVMPEDDLIANMANISAALHAQFSFLWVGFYLVRDQELVLGPFQGPVACTRISFGKGVCGSAWKEKRSLIVPDVSQFPGHIACSSLSKSEIVIPLRQGDNVAGVLDIDSEHPADFGPVDEFYLKKILSFLHFD